MLSNTSSNRLEYFFSGYDTVVIDEAQEIKNIGSTIKLITDKLKHIQVIATGSSAFELANRTAETLTGRKYEFMLFPLSFEEMIAEHGLVKEMQLLSLRLVFGYYQEIVIKPEEAAKHLKLIANSYLYKNLLRLDNIRRTDLLHKILKALALQIGSEVSYNELAQLCNTDGKTIERYIDLLTKAYIIFILPAYNKNIRNEIKKGKKIYFWDNGIRNAIIGNYNSDLSNRTDIGQLWENFLISERTKKNIYYKKEVNCYLWETAQQQEIDYIEEENQNLEVYEFKWNINAKAKIPTTFSSVYNVSKFDVITPKNIATFIGQPSF